MGTLQLHQYTVTDITHLANQAKEVLLKGLEEEGLLTTPADELSGSYSVIVHERGTLGRLWDKMLGQDDSVDLRFAVVKNVLPLPEKEEKA